MAQFKRGDFSTCDTPRPGRTKTVTTPEITDQIHELILNDHRISAKSIADQIHELILNDHRISAKSIAELVGISRERAGSIIHED